MIKSRGYLASLAFCDHGLQCNLKMGSAERGFRLPIISIAPYLDTQSPGDSAERDVVSKALHSACVEYGFFYLDISQYVELAEAEELTRLAREFFALPQAEKDKISLKHQDFARGAPACGFIMPCPHSHLSCDRRLSETKGKCHKWKGR